MVEILYPATRRGPEISCVVLCVIVARVSFFALYVFSVCRRLYFYVVDCFVVFVCGHRPEISGRIQKGGLIKGGGTTDYASFR